MVTGAYIHFGMQFIQLKSDIWSMGEERIELCPQLMLIHMTSNASLRANEQDDVGREFSNDCLQYCYFNFFCDYPEVDTKIYVQ